MFCVFFDLFLFFFLSLLPLNSFWHSMYIQTSGHSRMKTFQKQIAHCQSGNAALLECEEPAICRHIIVYKCHLIYAMDVRKFPSIVGKRTSSAKFALIKRCSTLDMAIASQRGWIVRGASEKHLRWWHKNARRRQAPFLTLPYTIKFISKHQTLPGTSGSSSDAALRPDRLSTNQIFSSCFYFCNPFPLRKKVLIRISGHLGKKNWSQHDCIMFKTTNCEAVYLKYRQRGLPAGLIIHFIHLRPLATLSLGLRTQRWYI